MHAKLLSQVTRHTLMEIHRTISIPVHVDNNIDMFWYSRDLWNEFKPYRDYLMEKLDIRVRRDRLDTLKDLMLHICRSTPYPSLLDFFQGDYHNAIRDKLYATMDDA